MRSQTERIIKDSPISYLLHSFALSTLWGHQEAPRYQMLWLLRVKRWQLHAFKMLEIKELKVHDTPNHLWFFTKSSSWQIESHCSLRLSCLSDSSSLAFSAKTLFLCLSLKPESPWMGSSAHFISCSIRELSPLQNAPSLWEAPLTSLQVQPTVQTWNVKLHPSVPGEQPRLNKFQTWFSSLSYLLNQGHDQPTNHPIS